MGRGVRPLDDYSDPLLSVAPPNHTTNRLKAATVRIFETRCKMKQGAEEEMESRKGR